MEVKVDSESDRRKMFADMNDAENETKSYMTRTTVDGRVLRYELTVLQQPERARACGQGAKSSTDRRPVDPPPIIELKIMEGDTDVTFKMNANYVIFASLEPARKIAKPRSLPAEKQTPAVLTGSPVAGMVYLERPNAAGYFIFSDLSIRHEGTYRLAFSLFEELKEPADADKMDDASSAPANPANAADSAAAGCLTYRMDVRSCPFIVWSAKKFPGLSESTELSRTVAEQGCRVRIRRDVRMRRRERKHGNSNYDNYENDTAELRARTSATPDPRMHMPHHSGGCMEVVPRPRSSSNASNQSHHTLAGSRRPSMQDLNSQPQYAHQPYSSGGPAPQSGPQGYAHGQVPYSPQQYQQPPPPPAYAPQQQAAAMAPPPFPTAGHTAASAPAPQQPYYGYQSGPSAAPPPQQQYEQRSYAAPTMPEQHHYAPAPPPVQHHHTSYMPQPMSQQQQQQTSAYSSAQYQSRVSQPSASSGAGSGISRPVHRNAPTLPPLSNLSSSSYTNDHHKLEPASPLPPSDYSRTLPAADSHKRSYGHVFNDAHHTGPLRNGERPRLPPSSNSTTTLAGITTDTSPPLDEIDDDDAGVPEMDARALAMRYRRADGRQIHRALPVSL